MLMIKDPFISVIIASYNHAPYIEDSIHSVLQQTYPNIELLVVDDGSKDDSVEKIKKMQAQYGFDFRSQANQGLAKTLNDCIARSQGRLIAPFGSDDVMLPERIKTQVEYLQDKVQWDECIRTLKRDTRRFAKRQFTWFGADQQIQWYQPGQLNEMIQQTEVFL